MTRNLSLITKFCTIIICLISLIFVGCSKKNKPFKVNLGTPGKSEVVNDIPDNDKIHTLESSEEIIFKNDNGLADVKHDNKRTLKEGDLIIGNDDQKLLLKVKKVIGVNEDTGSTEVELRQSRLDELVGESSATVNIETTPIYEANDLEELNTKATQSNPNQKSSFHVDDKGKITISNLELFSFNLNNSGQVEAGLNKVMGVIVDNPYDKFSMSGSAGGLYKATINEAVIEVIPTLRSKANWKLGSINQLETKFDTRVKYRIDMTFDLAGQISMEGLIDFLPKKVIPIKVGAPPIYVDIELGIPAGVKVKAAKSGKTRIVYETEYEFYSTMSYKKGEGVSTEKDQKVTISETNIDTANPSTKVEAELFLKPQVTARLYRVIGPYAYLKPYVRGEVDWPSTEKKDDLYVGVTGGVGIELSEPVFLNSIVSYDSGDIFNYYKSFDIDKLGGAQKPIDYQGPDENDIQVNQLGPEGFVLVKLKEKAGQDDLRYELVESTKTGLIVPADDFYFSGELYYYPLSHSQSETFQVRLLGRNGDNQITHVKLGVSESVIKKVSGDRFSMTSNSIRVTTESPGAYASLVPSHPVAVGINSSRSKINVENEDKISCNHKKLKKYFFEKCEDYIALQASYNANVISASSSELFGRDDFYVIKELNEDGVVYINPFSFESYVLKNKKIDCLPSLDIKPINKFAAKSETDSSKNDLNGENQEESQVESESQGEMSEEQLVAQIEEGEESNEARKISRKKIVGFKIEVKSCFPDQKYFEYSEFKKINIFGLPSSLFQWNKKADGLVTSYEVTLDLSTLNESEVKQIYDHQNSQRKNNSFFLIFPVSKKSNLVRLTSSYGRLLDIIQQQDEELFEKNKHQSVNQVNHQYNYGEMKRSFNDILSSRFYITNTESSNLEDWEMRLENNLQYPAEY